MRIAVGALVVAVGLAGCGGDGGDGGSLNSPLQGRWIATTNSCAIGLNLTGNAFTSRTVCPDVSTGLYDLREEDGTFTADEAKIYFHATDSTCPEPTPSYYNPYSVTATSLTLTYSDSLIVFGRNTSTGTGAVATYGCFVNGVFDPAPLVSL